MGVGLGSLIQDLDIVHLSANLDTEIAGISYDSRRVKFGDLFIAWHGLKRDGKDYIHEAIGRGAAVVCLQEGEDRVNMGNIPFFTVLNPRLALADLSRAFYRNPGSSMRVIGITGTNGKTTVSFLVESILDRAGLKSGLLGTIHYKIGRQIIPAERTTPESLDVQRFLREMADTASQAVVMEVSSHALDQGRVRGVDFCGAVFTNLSQDHLDYHLDMEKYFLAKSILFESLNHESFAAINIDDPYGMRLVKRTEARIISFGFSEEAQLKMGRYQLGMNGSSFELIYPKGRMEIRSLLIGQFNLYNMMAAFAVGLGMGLDPAHIKEGIESFQSVPGRMEFLRNDTSVQVVVDYAHTEDALKNVLLTLKPLIEGRLMTVFGCGGDRDRGKRPKMGHVSGTFSDVVILTSDNPRSEDPGQIAAEVEEGLKKTHTPYKVILDRKDAIEFALNEAKQEDLVLIAGKGHEKFQEIGHMRVPFDDVGVVKEFFAVGVKTRL